jgi:SAM-dependent methyltransferase
VEPRPRYDGFADWYDANIGPFAEPAGRELLELLGHGPGHLLDLACGGGINLRRLTDAGWSVTGVDLSADQLRLARKRAPAGIELIQADATALPFADGSFDAIACALLHTDVADFAAVCREAARVLKAGGRLAYVGIHPCFVGPFARNPPGEPPELHPGYRDTAWTTEGFSDGIRRRTGARHVPLAELLNAFLDAGLRLDRVTEAADEEFPTRIGILAARAPADEASTDAHLPVRCIRPIVIGVALRDGRLLAVEGRDPDKHERFYRPPGGGLDFSETSEEALRT